MPCDRWVSLWKALMNGKQHKVCTWEVFRRQVLWRVHTRWHYHGSSSCCVSAWPLHTLDWGLSVAVTWDHCSASLSGPVPPGVVTKKSSHGRREFIIQQDIRSGLCSMGPLQGSLYWRGETQIDSECDHFKQPVRLWGRARLRTSSCSMLGTVPHPSWGGLL